MKREFCGVFLLLPVLGLSQFDLTLNKNVVAGQNQVLATITLEVPASTSDVFQTYDNSSLVITPPSVTISVGELSRSFSIQTLAVNSSLPTTIYARKNVTVKSKALTLAPLMPSAMAFTANPAYTPSDVTGGTPSSCRVVINGVAGPGGRVLAIFDNSAYATTPSSVTVPPGATEVTFPIPTSAVSSIRVVTVTARVSAGEKTGTFLINP